MQHSSSAITSSDDDDDLFQDAFSSEHEDDEDAFPFAIDDGDADGVAQQDEAELAGDENNNYKPLFPDDGEIAADNQDDDTSKSDIVGGSVESEEANGKEALAATNSSGDALDSSTAGQEFSIGEDEDEGDAEGDDADCDISGAPPEKTPLPKRIQKRAPWSCHQRCYMMSTSPSRMALKIRMKILYPRKGLPHQLRFRSHKPQARESHGNPWRTMAYR